MKRSKKKTFKGMGLYLGPYRGKGILNSLINHLPVPLHIWGHWCGPGTDVKGQLARKIAPKDKLDSYCKEHDIFYMNNPDTAARNKADMRLADQAWNRVTSNDASLAEKAAAYAVTNLMKAKAKLGMGLKFKNKNNGQFSAVRGHTRHTPLSRCVSKKSIKKSKAKTKRKRDN